MNKPEPLRLSENEQELLKLAAESENFILLPMWKRIEIFLNSFALEALDYINGNQSSEPLVALRFQIIWKERQALRDSLVAFVKGPIKDKKELLEQIEEQRKAGMIYAGPSTND